MNMQRWMQKSLWLLVLPVLYAGLAISQPMEPAPAGAEPNEPTATIQPLETPPAVEAIEDVLIPTQEATEVIVQLQDPTPRLESKPETGSEDARPAMPAGAPQPARRFVRALVDHDPDLAREIKERLDNGEPVRVVIRESLQTLAQSGDPADREFVEQLREDLRRQAPGRRGGGGPLGMGQPGMGRRGGDPADMGRMGRGPQGMGRQGMDRPAMGPQGMGQPGMGRMGRGARFQGEFFAGGPRADAPRQARLRRHDCNCPYCPQGGDRMMLRRQDRDCWADELSQMIGAELNPETEPAVNAEAVDIEREHLQETIDRLEEEIGDLQERLNQPTGN